MVFRHNLWFFDQKSRVFGMPMYEAVRCFMFRVVRSKASCWAHLSWNFWRYNCLESICTRTVSTEKSDFLEYQNKINMIKVTSNLMNYGRVEHSKQFLIRPYKHSCNICPWKEFQTIFVHGLRWFSAVMSDLVHNVLRWFRQDWHFLTQENEFSSGNNHVK